MDAVWKRKVAAAKAKHRAILLRAYLEQPGEPGELRMAAALEQVQAEARRVKQDSEQEQP